MPHRNEARVLPDPVGARVRLWRPPAMAGHPWAWAAVGAPKVVVNHSRTGAEKAGIDAAAGMAGPGYGATLPTGVRSVRRSGAVGADGHPVVVEVQVGG